jgi:endonuclease/exonuclease/phosphatase family metal-dependent hydrolase
VVSGIFDGEPMHFIVNHWPSRRGDTNNSWMRNEAAKLARSLVDSIIQTDSNAKVVVMGDLNDDPSDESVRFYMKAANNKNRLKSDQIFNTMGTMFKNGVGTLAYQDKWNLFDQIIVTQPFISKQQSGYRFYSSRVFNDSFLQEKEGRFKGYPKRTYVGNEYKAGYSDHFPVYIVLVKSMK